jgi:7-cyano-7-deazaguanine synthase
VSAAGERALVVLSGGQDSTTCLYWAMDRFGRDAVSSITFDYGQKHRIELECASQVAAAAAVPNVCLPIDTFAALGGDALTDAAVPVSDDSDAESDLPVTFVAGRNLVFLTFAAAYAYRHDARHLVTGVAQTDYSGYPDCREETIAALQEAISLGMDREFTIHAPLMHRSKGETVELAVRLGALDAMARTHTCYNGRRPPCGECNACRLRAKGFAEAGVPDPLLEVT